MENKKKYFKYRIETEQGVTLEEGTVNKIDEIEYGKFSGIVGIVIKAWLVTETIMVTEEECSTMKVKFKKEE